MSMNIRGNKTHVSGVRHGTPMYISPEILRNGKASKAADVYSFGVMMWELCHGMLAWQQVSRDLPYDEAILSASMLSMYKLTSLNLPFHLHCSSIFVSPRHKGKLPKGWQQEEPLASLHSIPISSPTLRMSWLYLCRTSAWAGRVWPRTRRRGLPSRKC